MFASPHPLVIAHRGASGYLPEHTLAAKAMAYAQGADYLEQDLVLTRDDHLLVLHDHFLDRVTDVATQFPARAREDGRFYAIDFDLAEIRQLRVTELFERRQGRVEPVFPARFPLWTSRFELHTFEEEIEFIQGLNRSTGRKVGLYPEIKVPWFHRRAGKAISERVLQVLWDYGYQTPEAGVFLQCFDPLELERIHRELMPNLGMRLPTVQLIAPTDWEETWCPDGQGDWQPYDYDWMLAPGGMARIADYAEAIGPWLPMVVGEDSSPGHLQLTALVADAHRAGLAVHPYTLRRDQLPGYARDFNDLLDIFYRQAGVDGLFTDFPDLAVAYLRARWPLGASGAQNESAPPT